MSEVTESKQDKQDTPKRKRVERKRKAGIKRTSSGVVFASIGTALVSSGRVADHGTAMKRVRAVARSKHAEMVKHDRNLKRAKPSSNDGNRWPEYVTASAAKIVTDALRLS